MGPGGCGVRASIPPASVDRMKSNPQENHAIVLTGSGANAAYEVGVMRALVKEGWGRLGVERGADPGDRDPRHNPPVKPYCYAGTSVGALNAVLMVSQAECGQNRANPEGEAIEHLERLWQTRIPGNGADNGVFRLRADPTRYGAPDPWVTDPLGTARSLGEDLLELGLGFARRAGQAVVSARTPHDAVMSLTDFGLLADMTPLRELVDETIDFAALSSADRKLRISAINWERGTPVTFKNRDLDGADGFDAIAAALTIPGLISPPGRISQCWNTTE